MRAFLGKGIWSDFEKAGRSPKTSPDCFSEERRTQGVALGLAVGAGV
jgi:hypothetical protein